jgi:hypothetical protein
MKGPADGREGKRLPAASHLATLSLSPPLLRIKTNKRFQAAVHRKGIMLGCFWKRLMILWNSDGLGLV